MYEKHYPDKRFEQTLRFLAEVAPPPASVLDLGVQNPLSALMEQKGYTVSNTAGEDLDLDTSDVESSTAEIVTAFEIFEHLVAPFNVLRNIKARRLVTTVPLRLWFSSAYRSQSDPRDRHFHEFETWQFDWLLQKSGWKIKKTRMWTNPVGKIGIRPLLRSITPRYYAVYAERD